MLHEGFDESKAESEQLGSRKRTGGGSILKGKEIDHVIQPREVKWRVAIGIEEWGHTD